MLGHDWLEDIWETCLPSEGPFETSAAGEQQQHFMAARGASPRVMSLPRC
jgi:hypothetical protein